jgi:hypothetical protein
MEFNLETVALLIVVVGQIVTLVVAIRKPNEDQDVKLASAITTIKVLEKELESIKTNHLAHLQSSLALVENRLTAIETILKERLPRNI